MSYCANCLAVYNSHFLVLSVDPVNDVSRAEAIQILGSQFDMVAMEVTGGNATLAGDIDDIKARANAAFAESLKKVCLIVSLAHYNIMQSRSQSRYKCLTTLMCRRAWKKKIIRAADLVRMKCNQAFVANGNILVPVLVRKLN